MISKREKTGDKIIKILSTALKPIDVETLIEKLKVNKTTIYRQIDKLLLRNLIVDVEFGDGKKRYELKSLGHHHHLICKKCGKLEDVTIDEESILKQIKVKSGFKIESHSLEFFGFCNNCN